MRRTHRGGTLALLMLALLLPSGLLAGCGGANDTRDARWSYISTVIIQPSCATANCHSNLTQRSGVELDGVQDGYAQLINRFFVIPGHPEDSSLIALLRAEGTRRMPPDFPLPTDDIVLIEKWIAAGAIYTGPSPAPNVTPGTVASPLTIEGN